MKPYLIEIEHADVVLNGEKVLHDVSWKLGTGEHWAVVGPNGAGKTTFLKLARGDVWPAPASRAKRIYRLGGEEQDVPFGLKRSISLVTPELYHFYARNDLNLPVEEVVWSGFFDTVWLYDKPSLQMKRAAGEIMKLVGLEGKGSRNFLELSQGEARKVLIARALVPNPRVLLLDEVCDGLDISSRSEVMAVLEDTARAGTQLIYATHRQNDLIPSTSHALVMKAGRITKQGRKEAILPLGDKRTALQKVPSGPKELNTLKDVSGRRRSRLIEVKNATVYLQDKRVLDKIDWEIGAGEKWVVLGKNGSGKTSLLRLIEGSLHPALGGCVRRFGAEAGENVWKSRKKIGSVSPELQAFYSEDLSGTEVVVSGFFSSVGLYRRATRTQRQTAHSVMHILGIDNLGTKLISEMSYGEFRKILIARAMVKKPEILLLDEPFNGLDYRSRAGLRDLLNALSFTGIAVVLVTHHLDEIMPSVTHALILDKGKVIAQGRREEVMREGILERTGIL